ncbi:hypothetical protein F2Q70_00045460 [Brassica cretica]|uniref:Uncharacterized protein n=1 Tax=Brassica cretica TaxID=69181 RepID=A0A8S9KIK8_BRACR|nr:hypothetical protein F2Q70_00045460 [Brassica cretica]
MKRSVSIRVDSVFFCFGPPEPMLLRRAAPPPLLEPAAVSEKPEIFAVVESLWERICSFWILRRFGYAGALVSVAIGKSAIAVDLISCHSWKLKLVESTLKSVLLDAHRCLSKVVFAMYTCFLLSI